jgi:hypothetical protein
MKKQLVHVSTLKSAQVMAVIYLVMSLPAVLFSYVPAWLGTDEPPPTFMLVLGPVLYTFFGYLFTLVGAWLYNHVAARIGGFEFTVAVIGQAEPSESSK